VLEVLCVAEAARLHVSGGLEGHAVGGVDEVVKEETAVRVGIGGGDVGEGGRGQEVDDDALQAHVDVWVN
jgi:hypothetical protein